MVMVGSRTRLLLGVVLGAGLFASLITQPASAAGGDTTPPAPFDLVADAGDYQTGYSIASPWTSVSVSWVLTSDTQSALVYDLAVDGAVQRTVAPDHTYSTMTKRVDVPEGRHQVTVTAVDSAGNRRNANQSLDVLVDGHSPTFTSVPKLLMRRGPVSMDAIPVRYTWTATDVGSGLAQVRIGYGPTCCTFVDVNATRYDFTVASHSDRNWRVFLYDGVGRREHFASPVQIDAVPNSDLKRHGSWRMRPVSGALGQTEWLSRTSGDRMAVRVRGRSVAWVATTGPKRGTAYVYVDNRRVAKVNLSAAKARTARTVWTSPLVRGSSHQVAIVNGSSTKRSTIGVDAILVQD
jgi:hypothetical protein